MLVLLPFLFVLTPSLLMDGPAYLIGWNFARILFGLFVGTAGIVGFALRPLSLPARFVYGLLSIAVLLPPEAFTGANYVNVAGIFASTFVLAIERMRRAQATALAQPS